MCRTHKTMSKVIKTSSMKFCALCFLVFAVCLMFSFVSSEAKVTGSCSNCHTMHNSQNGQPMAYDFDGTSFTKTSTPKDGLLIYNCLGCHSATDGITWQDSVTRAPIVFNTVEPTYGAMGSSRWELFLCDYNR